MSWLPTIDGVLRPRPRRLLPDRSATPAVSKPGTAAGWSLMPADDEDFEALLSLRLAAMHESLQRLGRFDPQRARERLSRAFEPQHTRHILQDGRRVGFVVVLPMGDHLALDHLYIAPEAQRQGIGHWVIERVLALADAQGLPVRVTALKLSDANRFYQRHGFILQSESDWDLHYLRPCPLRPAQPPAAGPATTTAADDHAA